MPKITPIEAEKLKAFISKTLANAPPKESRLKEPRTLKEIMEATREKIFGTRKP